ncbi:hypothetical protein MNBD_GAMMA07-1420 [hydrothermal vent metagenome]|uniref:Uncharacterized protein n=1 Tax=hydrothermal vent metagenome TaxID=652676 RepID=A0A3B0X653_9ZZZZ
MSDTLLTVLEKAASKMLRPLVRVMLRNGVACGSFEEMLRKTYVDEAFLLAKQEGKATISAVSAKTGLSRKEVKRLSEKQLSSVNDNSKKYNRAIRVISGWVNDERFSSRDGVPQVLNMEDGPNAFSSLVKDYSGDIPTRAMFDLLEKSGCVEKHSHKVHLVSRAYVPGNDPVDIINILGTDSQELMETIIYNMSCDSEQRRFQRKVSTHKLASVHFDKFQKHANRRSQALLEELDSWLSEHEAESKSDEQSAVQSVGLGIYYYQNNPGAEDEV